MHLTSGSRSVATLILCHWQNDSWKKTGGKQAQKDSCLSPRYLPNPVSSSSGSQHPSPAILHQETLLWTKKLLVRWLMLPETNCSWEEQNCTTSTNGKRRVGSDVVGKSMWITADSYSNLCSLAVVILFSPAGKPGGKLMERKITEACCARNDDFCSSGNFSRFMNTKEQEDTEVLFHSQWNYNSYDQCNPLFPLRVTNAILCRQHSENVKGCEKSHAARQLLTEYLSEALEWELFKEDKKIKSIIR